MGLQDRLRRTPKRLAERGAQTSLGWKGLDVTGRFPRVGIPLYILYRALGSDRET